MTMGSLFEMQEETIQINHRSKMESGLLSSFHDDHFDGNYSKYDSFDVWSDRNDGMGLQLSETLRGNLAMAGNEKASHFLGTDLDPRIPFRFETENDDLTGTTIEMDKNMDEDYLLMSYEASNDTYESMSSRDVQHNMN